MEPEFTFVLFLGLGVSGSVVTGWIGLDLAAILTRLRAASRFDSRILVALLSGSSSFPLSLYLFINFPSGPFHGLP